MALKQSLNARQTQQMALTPQQRQSLEVLQSSIIDLQQLVEQEVANNPVLESLERLPEERLRRLEELIEEPSPPPQGGHLEEESDPESSRPSREHLLATVVTLEESLLRQLRIAAPSRTIEDAGEFLIRSLDERGYLETSLDQLVTETGRDLATLHAALELVQGFDPPGIGARDLAECLLLQLRRAGQEGILAFRVIAEGHLEALGQRCFKTIARTLKCTEEELREAAKAIARLTPKPASASSSERPAYVIPDIHIERLGERWEAQINEGELPRLRINATYRDLLRQTDDTATRDFLRAHLERAQGLIQAIRRRQETLRAMVAILIATQAEALEKGLAHLKPMTLKELSQRLGCHESTASRMVALKYVETPLGVVPLRAFFSAAVTTNGQEPLSAPQIKGALGALVASEDPKHPLSDQALAERFTKQGISIARRTVAKYREALSIPPAHLRRHQ